MTALLAAIGHGWQDLADGLATWQAELLRRSAADMADALDRAAMRDVEGAKEWRDLGARRRATT